MASLPSLPAGPAGQDSGGRSRTVNMLEAKTHLSRLVEAIETGAESEVVIARNGRPVARLTSLESAQRPRRLGVASGQFQAPDSIDAANPLIAELFEQG
jgi:prevent-host-death family protein